MRFIENPPANARDMGSIPRPGRFQMPWDNKTHAPQLPSLRTSTTEVHAPYSPCLATGEATAMRSLHTATTEQPLLPATRESLYAATKIQPS